MVFLHKVSPPREGIRHEEVDITAVLDGKDLGSGTLCVAESCVSWLDGSGVGFNLDYPSISLHAISRDLSAYPSEHLYMQVNIKNEEDLKDDEEKTSDEATTKSDDEDEDDDDNSSIILLEIRLVPKDKASLETMFAVMTECQALHPDPDDSESDAEGDEYDVEEAEQGQIDLPTYYSFEEGMSQLTVEGQATLEKLEGMLARSSASSCCMDGVRTADVEPANDNKSKSGGTSKIPGQFDDAEVDH